MSIDYTINIRGKYTNNETYTMTYKKNRNNQWAQTNKQITYITTKLN